jgi:multicomponent Na+:H+ antiporter subunit F
MILTIALGLLMATMLAASWRIMRGPTDADRAVAADLLFFATIALIAVLGVRAASTSTFDIMLIATLVGFLGVLSLSRALTRGRR